MLDRNKETRIGIPYRKASYRNSYIIFVVFSTPLTMIPRFLGTIPSIFFLFWLCRYSRTASHSSKSKKVSDGRPPTREREEREGSCGKKRRAGDGGAFLGSGTGILQRRRSLSARKTPTSGKNTRAANERRTRGADSDACGGPFADRRGGRSVPSNRIRVARCSLRSCWRWNRSVDAAKQPRAELVSPQVKTCQAARQASPPALFSSLNCASRIHMHLSHLLSSFTQYPPPRNRPWVSSRLAG